MVYWRTRALRALFCQINSGLGCSAPSSRIRITFTFTTKNQRDTIFPPSEPPLPNGRIAKKNNLSRWSSDTEEPPPIGRIAKKKQPVPVEFPPSELPAIARIAKKTNLSRWSSHPQNPVTKGGTHGNPQVPMGSKAMK